MPTTTVNLSSPVTSSSLNTGLTAWWRCVPNGTYSTSLTDFVGGHVLNMGGNSGIGLSGLTTPPSKVLHFSDYPPVGYADAADAAAWDIAAATGNFTLSAWVYFWDLTPGFFLQHWTGAYDNWYWYYASSSIVLTPSRVNSSDTSGLSWSWSPSINNWYHVVIKKSGNDYTAYVDGSQLGSTQTVSWAWNVKTGVLRAGAFDGSSGYDLSGGLDNIRIYSRALSSTEVKALYGEDLGNDPTLLNWQGEGSRAAGSATVRTAKLTSGGSRLGGSATVSIVATPSPAGGSVAGSAAVPAAHYGLLTAGGAIVSGSSLTSLRTSVEASGGMLAGSQSIVWLTVSPATSGGSVVGGGTTGQIDETSSGGIEITGEATVSHTTFVRAAGGAVLAGAAGLTVDLSFTGSGSVEISGEAIFQTSANYVATGGAVLGGSAIVLVVGRNTYTEVASGGAVLSGSASVTEQQAYEPKEIDVDIRLFLIEKLSEEFPDVDWTEYGRITEGFVVQNPPSPRIWYRRSGEEDINGKHSGVTRTSFDVEIYSDAAPDQAIGETQGIAYYIKQALDGYRGPMAGSHCQRLQYFDHDDSYIIKGNGNEDTLPGANLYLEVIWS